VLAAAVFPADTRLREVVANSLFERACSILTGLHEYQPVWTGIRAEPLIGCF